MPRATFDLWCLNVVCTSKFFSEALIWSFLHQLTHNMTRYCSLNSRENTSSEHFVYKNYFLLLFWHSKQYLYTTCSEVVFFREFNELSLVILWINWFKNESFWHRFTCNTEYGHKKAKSLILCGSNANPNRKLIFGMWI